MANDLAGTGTLLIDAGATLVLSGRLPNQTIEFAANSIAQLSNDPYSPSTLVLNGQARLHGQPDHRLHLRRRLVLTT